MNQRPLIFVWSPKTGVTGSRFSCIPLSTWPAQGLKTLVHALAHALLHGDEVVRTQEIQDVEVESVAYSVCDALGLDTSGYSFAYVARW